MKLSELHERYHHSPKRPKGLRFFAELNAGAQEYAISAERESGDCFDWDDAEFLTEDFKTQLAENGFADLEVYWSLAYCQGDGVAFYGQVEIESLKAQDPEANKLIKRLENAGDEISVEITGRNHHYHHWNSMTVELEIQAETEEEDLPARLKIARPLWREELEGYLTERVKEISWELEKSGYAEIAYHCDDETIRDRLAECKDLYEKDGRRVRRESEFYQWLKTQQTTEQLCSGSLMD